jgi:ribonuclease BN (tRNA processing enzyme)
LNILFTGTGSGKTSLNRYHSSLVISVHNFNLLVDAGDSISRALLSADINYNKIDGILITHLHPDHFSGFASLIVQMEMSERTEPISVFVHHMLIKTVRDFLSASYVFPERMGYALNFREYEFDTDIKVSDELLFRARRNTHLDKYQKNDPSVSPASSSLLFTSGDKRVFYSGDLGSEDDLYLFKDYSTDLYITEAAHVSIENILEMMKKLNPGKVMLTHIEEKDVPEIRKKLNASGESRISIAEEGINLSVKHYRG